MKSQYNRIKIINHKKNLGIYHSRVEAVLNSKGEYIFFLDSDDMILNSKLFEILYYYNKSYNLDIIEFTVYYQIEAKKKRFFFPEHHFYNHNHNFKNRIIYQPELSTILFYLPNSKNYSYIICRTVWNKIYRKNILLKSIHYIGLEYFKLHYFILAEDTLINLISFQYSNNYSNINIPGYMYNFRQSSISHLKGNKKHLINESISFYLFFKLFLKYTKDFDKDWNYIFYELKAFNKYFQNFKIYNLREYNQKVLNLLYEIEYNNKSSTEIKNYIKKLITIYN